jgi:hypothetical protein
MGLESQAGLAGMPVVCKHCMSDCGQGACSLPWSSPGPMHSWAHSGCEVFRRRIALPVRTMWQGPLWCKAMIQAPRKEEAKQGKDCHYPD